MHTGTSGIIANTNVLKTPKKGLESAVVVEEKLPQERVDLTVTPSTAEAPSKEAQVSAVPVEVKPTPETIASSPSTLAMEFPPTLEVPTDTQAEGAGVLQTMTQSMAAKASSEAHWDAATEAFKALPLEDKTAAGRRAFYTQASMLPEFAETLASLPLEKQLEFPLMLYEAKQSGAIDGDELAAKVAKWSEENPEQSYMAQMSGFADYAGQQLFSAAVKQGVEKLSDLQVGPREQTLADLSAHGNDYVVDRGQYIGGVHKLTSSGLPELAQQLLDS